MAILKHITQGGFFGSLNLIGNDRDKDRGIVFDHPPDQTAVFDQLTFHNTFVPITKKKGSGKVIIKNVKNSLYGGDLIDDWCGGLDIGMLFSRDNKPTRPYSHYHQDIYQADVLILVQDKSGRWRLVSDPNGIHTGSRIRQFDVKVTGDKSQGLVYTGKGKFINSVMGENGMNIELGGYARLVNAYQLAHSQFGGRSNAVNGDIYIKNRYNMNNHRTESVVLNNLPLNRYSEGDIQLVNDFSGFASKEQYQAALEMMGQF